MTGAPFRGGRLAWVALLAAAVLPYLPSLTVGFAFDDGGLVRDNPAVWAPGPGPAWSTPYWPSHPQSGLYRPWVTFSYWWNAKLTGHGAAGFHGLNILIHAAVVLVLWRLLRRLFPAQGTLAFVTSLLFALHPLHSEAVTAIVGRAETWAALWGLLAYRWALEYSAERRGGGERRGPWLAASAGAFALALLSKESTAGLLLLPAGHVLLPLGAGASPDRSRRWNRWRTVGLSWLALLALVLWERRAVLGAVVGLDRPSLSDNVLAHTGAVSRILAALGFQWLLIGKTLVPWKLAADYSYPQLVPTPLWMAAGAVLAAAAVILLVWRYRHRDLPILWGFLLLFAAGAVTANVVFPVGTVLAERLAYLPSAASLWLLLVAGARLAPFRQPSAGARRLAVAAIGVWGAFLFARTFVRNSDWKGDLRLFTASVEASPRSAKAWSNLAVAQLDHGQLAEALKSSERALELIPEYPGALEVRATALTQAGRPADAVPLLRAALRDPRPRPRSLTELGNAFLSLGQGAAAESAFVAAARVAAPTDFHPAVGLASALALQQRWSESEAAWRQAIRLAPADRDIRRSWAYTLWKSGSADQAETVYRELLVKSPTDPATCNDYAWFLLEARANPEAALPLARRAFSARPDATTGDTLLEALWQSGGCETALAWCDSLRRAGVAPGLVDPLESTLRDRCNEGRKRVP